MQCPQCSAQVENERWVTCPSCGSPLAPNLAVRVNPDALGGAGAQRPGEAVGRGGGSAVIWIALLILVLVVGAILLRHR